MRIIGGSEATKKRSIIFILVQQTRACNEFHYVFKYYFLVRSKKGPNFLNRSRDVSLDGRPYRMNSNYPPDIVLMRNFFNLGLSFTSLFSLVSSISFQLVELRKFYN